MYHLSRYFGHCLDIEIVDVLKVQGPAMFIVIYLITCYNVIMWDVYVKDSS